MSTASPASAPATNRQATFRPFYVRLAGQGHPFIAQTGVAVLSGCFCMTPHFITTDTAAILRDLSWMVGVMTSAAMLLLYYATATLAKLITEVGERTPAQSRNRYLDPLHFWLSDAKFIAAGCFFGGLNCLMGHLFGVNYTDLGSKTSMFFAFFVVGFVCGMAAYGLIGVLDFTRGFVATEPRLDYREPDKCGGTSFYGDALVKFSVVNLVMGALISYYIVFAPWAHRTKPLVHCLMGIWIAFPFVVSLSHLLGPGAFVHSMLRNYKKREQRSLSVQIAHTRSRIAGQRNLSKELRDDLEYDLKLQAELYRMKTWPFSVASTAHVALALLGETVPACLEVLKLIKLVGEGKAT